MKVFLSHSYKDSFLAEKISSVLEKNGLDVWRAEAEVLPGDNMAEKISDALKESDAMVVLISPAALASKYVQSEISYALGDKSYNRRLIPVVVGSEANLPSEEIPWILKHLQPIRLSQPEESDSEINQITEALRRVA